MSDEHQSGPDAQVRDEEKSLEEADEDATEAARGEIQAAMDGTMIAEAEAEAEAAPGEDEGPPPSSSGN